MSAWCRRRAAVGLLALFCLTAGCAASEQQPSTSSNATSGKLLSFIRQAIQAEIKPIVMEFEARANEMGRKLDNQQSQHDRLAAEMDTLRSLLASLNIPLGNQESRVPKTPTAVDGQQHLPADLATISGGEQPQLETITNSTSEQARTGELQRAEARQEETLPRECSDLPAEATSGVHLIQAGLEPLLPPVLAYCDMDTDGGGWTVFQRRDDVRPRQDFNRKWEDYKRGFGELEAEFWWGLDHLWRLTSTRDQEYELRIDLVDFEGKKRHAVYQNFRISSEENGYRLTVTNFTGNAGNSLQFNVDTMFSTTDKNHSGSRIPCAQLYYGGWWFTRNCGMSNLNGMYMSNPVTRQVSDGIIWVSWKGIFYSLKKTTMKFRAV